MEHDGDKRMNVWKRERRKKLVMIVMPDQALMVLSPSPWNSILNIPVLVVSLGLIVVPTVSWVSVNCVVVVVRKTIGPFERDAEAFEGIEYDIEWELGRVSSELMPRPIRTMISENCIRGKKKKGKRKIMDKLIWYAVSVIRDYVRRCPVSEGGVKGNIVWACGCWVVSSRRQ
jgi:hypothetical protein